MLQAGSRKTVKLRNTTLLRVVTPLYQFVKRLPAYTKQTQELSKESLGVLKALQETLEPDEFAKAIEKIGIMIPTKQVS